MSRVGGGGGRGGGGGGVWVLHILTDIKVR